MIPLVGLFPVGEWTSAAGYLGAGVDGGPLSPWVWGSTAVVRPQTTLASIIE
jgi:hypothetical protein